MLSVQGRNPHSDNNPWMFQATLFIAPHCALSSIRLIIENKLKLNAILIIKTVSIKHIANSLKFIT